MTTTAVTSGTGLARPSTPPLFSALKNSAAAALDIRLRPWQEALAAYLQVES